MYKKRDRGYHIDYIFAHKDMINDILDFWVGEYEKWIEYSDHMPLFFETSN
jgi:exonuclease III